MIRRGILVILLLFASACTSPAPSGTSLVLITIDSLRADHLSAYGYPDAYTPNLDRLARHGIENIHAAAPAPFTLPALISLQTGLYPSQHGVYRTPHNPELDEDIVTLGEGVETLATRLLAAGYETAAFTPGGYTSSVFGFDRGFQRFEDHFLNHKYGMELQNELSRFGEPRKNGDAIAWLDARRNPYFLWLHYFDPHWSYDPPPPYQQLYEIPTYQGRLQPQFTPYLDPAVGPSILELLNERDWQQAINLYDAEIAYTDRLVGEIIRTIHQDRKRTVHIAVTADHGEEFMDHGSASHGWTVYQEQIDIPLLSLTTRRSDHYLDSTRTDLVGLYQSLLMIAGQPLPDYLSGNFQAPGTEPAIYCERSYTDEFALRQGDWKYIRRKPQATAATDKLEKLFDLSRDAMEQNNLAAEHPELILRFREALRLYLSTHLPRRLRPQPISLDDLATERLRALGYLE